jgi:hypothetical protein
LRVILRVRIQGNIEGQDSGDYLRFYQQLVVPATIRMIETKIDDPPWAESDTLLRMLFQL